MCATSLMYELLLCQCNECVLSGCEWLNGVVMIYPINGYCRSAIRNELVMLVCILFGIGGVQCFGLLVAR